MIVCILLPLFVSWIFKKLNFKRIFFTYLISGMFILILPILSFIIKFSTMSIVDATTIAFDKAPITALIGSAGLTLFMTAFFQYIFNNTMNLNGIKK